MAAYSGSGLFPYWMTIAGDGTHANPSAISENIPVQVGVLYQFQAIAAFPSTFAGGIVLSLEFFQANGTAISTFTGTQTAMTGGTLYQVNTGQVTAPALASFAVATIKVNGTPLVANACKIFQAEIDNGVNSLPLNINYTFTFTTLPWTASGTGAVLAWNHSPILPGDSDSLVLAGLIETMGGAQGVPCIVPELLDSNGQGPTFRILAPPSLNSAAFGYESSYDLNAPQPTQDVVASMLLDGERPFGSRASNRTISLPIVIFGTQAGGMNQVLRAREYLMQLIDQQTWQMKWTAADTGLPMIFDCFRALPSTPIYGFNYSSGGTATGQTIGKPNYPIGMITLEIQALPYGRSDVDGVQELAFTSPLLNYPSAPTSATPIDQFNTGFTPPPVIARPTFAALGTASPTASSSFNVAISTAVAAGNTAMVVVMSAANTVTGVTDTQGNAYTLASTKNTTGACFETVWLAQVQTALATSDHFTVTASGSANFAAAAYSITGAWAASGTLALNTSGTTATFSGTALAAQYDLLISSSIGLASSGGTPAGWNSIATVAGNGFDATLSWFTMPVTQSSTPVAITTLPNPWALTVLALVPVNIGWNFDSTTPPPNYVGHSVHWSAPRPVKSPYPQAVYARTLAAPLSITSLPVLSFQFGQAYDTQWAASSSFLSNVTFYFTLTDSSGNTLNFSTAYKKVTWGANPSAPKWTQVNAAIPQGRTFNYNALKSYQITVTNWAGSGYNGYVRMHCWLNNLVANPPTIQNQISPRGNLYNLFSLPGSARSPISVQCQLPASVNVVKEITSPATGNWIVPPGVYSVQAEAWAGGGAGAATNLARTVAGGGGGGAEYSQEPGLSVLPGAQVPWSIGSGGTPGQLVPTVIQFTTPGLGHWTCPAGVTTVLMEAWGGGGAGAAGGGGGGGAGYGSKQQAVTPGVTYYVWVATGGKADTGTSAAQNLARVGGNSYVASGPTGTYLNSVVAASGGNACLTGGSSGGSAGDNTSAPGTAHQNGGRGGNAPGPSGGGGGGAGGIGGPGSQGGDSQAYVASAGHWQTGGIAGQGTGQGGDGGAGANTPGFPGAGAQPGGGGGGGYQTSPLYNASNPSIVKPGSHTTNFLGGDGGAGMVQFTYAIGNGSPVNGGNTTFGSAPTTTTIVTANGGGSAANNSAAGGAGGTGSTNTIHASGGAGGLVTSGALGSYISSPTVSTLFTFLKSLTYSSNTGTTAASAASVAQGVSVALIESTAAVADLVVTDSAGNQYQNVGQVTAGAGTATLYAYVANIEFAITTSTTLTALSATSQQYGILWYASPWLVSGVTSANSGSGEGTSSSFTGQFGVSDTLSIQLELGVVISDGTTTVSALTQTKTWFNASTTNALAAGALGMAAYVMQNQGGGTGQANSGDVFSGTLSGSANWGTLCLPFTVINQQASVVKMDWRTGTTPGASTTWATEAAISANGMIMVIGQCGSGATITSGPSAIADQSGNVYQFKNTTLLPSNSGVIFVATAQVTGALAAGATGTYRWGTASAAPEYAIGTYWIPNAVGASAVDAVTAFTGTGTAVSGSYTPSDPNEMLFGVYGVANAAAVTASAPAAPWNSIDTNSQAYLQNHVYASQLTDEGVQPVSETLSSSSPWALLLMGIQLNLAGTGGGSAGGAGGAGYPAVWQFGGPGYSGGGTGKGGSGGSPPAGDGNGAGTPGGGGGGALGSSAQAQEGGQGGNGMIRLTWVPPLQPFNTLIVHSLGIGSNPNVNPCCPIPITDQPNNTEYPIPSVNGLQPAAFSSTYTVLLVNYVWDAATASSARQITVSINQYAYPGGPRATVQVSRAVTPATDIVNGIVNMGEVTLPVKDYSTFNDQSYFTVSINDTDLNDVFMDVLFLDTLGQTTTVSIDPGNPGYGQYVNYFFDEATPDRDLGFIGASFQDRQHSISVLDSTQISGGAMYVGPGDNLFFVYSTQGAPNLSVNYAPRWYLDRSQ